MKLKLPSYLFPLLMMLSVVIGIMIGTLITSKKHPTNKVQALSQKYGQILHLLNEDYVDSIPLEDFNDEAIESIIKKLDPHTRYIPKVKLKLAKTGLQKNIEGIGVEFKVIEDTLFVIKTVKNGPAELAGILPGDKFTHVDGIDITGLNASYEQIVNSLQGASGSEVNITVFRNGQKQTLNVVRKSIKIDAVESAYLIDSITGYIKLKAFARGAHDEFESALTLLNKEGMKNLIFDLRDNGGGLISEANNILDELLPKGSLFVYTKGKNERSNTSYYANKEGLFEKGRLIVLINENAASASEIVAGAIQGNDRGVIIGRRSFGKGLVQQPTQLIDGSELWFTISRYYTPSGRCIQKSYALGDSAYNSEYINRFSSGELYTKDSIKVIDTLKYLTNNGRIVYGGGGIMPDIFVGLDTVAYTNYLGNLYAKDILNMYAIKLYLQMKDSLKKITFVDYRDEFAISAEVYNSLVNFASKLGVEGSKSELLHSKSLITTLLKALIARIQWGDNEFYKIKNENDSIINESKTVMGNDRFDDYLQPKNEKP